MRLPRPIPDTPGRDQESVWSFPRPAIVQPTSSHLVVEAGGRVLADTVRGARVLETSHPPTYYFPPEDVDMSRLVPASARTFCEWKGGALYHDVVLPDRVITDAAWSYPEPEPSFLSIKGWFAFYASLMDACLVDGERVQPQRGGFYGGWITSRVTGPFKGPPGTEFW